MTAENGKGRPSQKATQNPDGYRADESSSSSSHPQDLEARADLAFRIAALTVCADRLAGRDEFRWVRVQLLDLRDVLEALDRDGQVTWR